jgi:AraC family transcriptional regulator
MPAGEEGRSMDVRIEPIPPIRVAGYAHRGPYHTIGAAWDRLNRELGAHAELLGPATMMVSVYYDDPGTAAPEALRSLAAISLDDTHRPPEGFTVDVLPASRCAVATHLGPYERLGEAWGELAAWARANGHEPASQPCFEVYRNDPRTTQARELATELYLPLAGSEEDPGAD